MDKPISFIVCSNGYGHLKRVLLVINEILQISPDQEINLFCTEEHSAFAKKEINFKSKKPIRFDTGISVNEISWIHADRITVAQYTKWKKDLEENETLAKSSLVISDNHLLPARVYRNSLLMGSFLWHDATVLSNPDIETIRKEELDFLRENKTGIICVGDMVMPGVEAQTETIKMPWFTVKHPKRFENRSENEILVTGGGTELINASLLKITDHLSQTNPGKVFFLDHKLFTACSFKERANIKAFGFSDRDFRSLSAVICRPGVGILTDCVTYSLPCVVINDSYNKEIDHNASCVNRLGIGKSFDSAGKEAAELSASVTEIINNAGQLKLFTERLETLETGGASRAAAYILGKSVTYE